MFRFWLISLVSVVSLIGARLVLFQSDSQDRPKHSRSITAAHQEIASDRMTARVGAANAKPIQVSRVLPRSETPSQPSIVTLIQARKYDSARLALVEKINSSPEDESLIEELAFLLADKLGEKKEARLMFQKLLELNPENSLALGVYKDLSTSHAAKEQAIDFLATQADRCQPCFDLRLVTADLLVGGRRLTEANAMLDTLADSSLTESQMRHLSSLYLRLGRTELAHSWLQRAMELASNAEPKLSRNHVSSAWRNHDRTMLRQLANDSGQGI